MMTIYKSETLAFKAGGDVLPGVAMMANRIAASACSGLTRDGDIKF